MDISTPFAQWATHLTLAQDANPSGVLGAPSGNTTTEGSQPLGTTSDPAGGSGAPAPSFNMIMMVMIMFAGILIISSLSGRKERKKHANLMASLGKKDKVRAAGGIIGTIIEIKNDEVLLETDRASNTRIRVARSSISSVISSKSSPVPEDSVETPELAEK